MKLPVYLTPLALCLALITACASSGPEKLKAATEQSLSTVLIKGKTTRDQVRTQFGKPEVEAVAADGGDVWRYNYTSSSPKLISLIPIIGGIKGGSDVTKKELVVYLNGQGVVNHYTLNESKTQTAVRTDGPTESAGSTGTVGSLTRPVGAGTLPGKAVNIPDAPAASKLPIVPVDSTSESIPSKVTIPTPPSK